MFVVDKLMDDRSWQRGIDIFWGPGPAATSARRRSQKEKCTTRVRVWPDDEGALQVLETFHYVPPAPRDVTALTKEIFG